MRIKYFEDTDTTCAPTTQSTEFPLVTPQSTPTSSPTPVKELEPPQPTGIITPTFSVDHSLEKCLTIKPEKSVGINSNGYLILDAFVDSNGLARFTTYQIDMKNKVRLEISNGFGA